MAHPHSGGLAPSSLLEEREGAGAQVFARHLDRLKLEREPAAADDSAAVPFWKRQSTTSSGEGQAISNGSNSAEAAGYTCDDTTCVLPSCHCASVNPPGRLSPKNTPQFITVTADDAVNTFTIEVLDYLLSKRKNPNGCQPKMTYFNSLMYSNYSMVTDWFVAGNEIADHTMTHVGDPPAVSAKRSTLSASMTGEIFDRIFEGLTPSHACCDLTPTEINGNLAALNAFSGIPLVELKGFRAPMLNFSSSTLTTLHTSGFLYDSSATSASPADVAATDAYWPYTLDNGLANNCLDVTGVCKGALKLPGLWEVPMHVVFEANNASDIHLMDPWLDSEDMSEVLAWLRSSFLSHYSGNRQPFGLYTHPIHLAVNYPGLTNPTAQREMLQEFLDWVQTFPDVWFVKNQQLLAWMRDPKSNNQIAQSPALQCSTPAVDASLKICNGLAQNEAGLLLQCPFTEFSWTNCYGCPVTPPTPQNPVPAQNTTLGVRAHLPTNCSTPFFDPVGNRCTCAASSCDFTDQTRPIGNYSTPLSDGNSATGAAGGSFRASEARGTSNTLLTGSTSTSGRGSSTQTSIPRQLSTASQLLIRVTLAAALAFATFLILLS
ncbi:hypothetical protein MVLG_07058 [Microbotryum lychnidis-dioicae p1A1 Lamole]|uniref:NodB homology domain-containing protein n=1 Tax=Microbotryum lychnidis-dioicae (strain p1A1 Lamole / MvSl-1064) TaxID=683840 RepID=U5HJ70_USTV1|nr:hypothetical protein MVLG_07058 [Microbotryum lychnidis-dioicae p1A1 Lamole]|eukprot:KDE02386.1 hypothetical protein MVLG_07058 [Microbotryum lychnidis-dioicae p1A1 Lamole]